MRLPRGLKALKPGPTIRDHWSADRRETGFGLRVRPSGVKSWLLYTRRKTDGEPVMVTLGRFPDMTLAMARRKAVKERAKVNVGQSPADEGRAERDAARNTVAALFKAYGEHVEVRRRAGEMRSWPQIQRSLERDVLPEWGARPVTEIRRRDALELVTRKAADTGETLRHLFKLLLIAGQRLGETSRMKWADVDLDAKLWTIPATETKDRMEHRVPLSEPAVELLKARQETAHPLATYVFPSSAKTDAPVLVWSKRTASALAALTGIAFTAHDLRRTVATMMGELGTDADTIGLVLNHRKSGVTTRHYDHSTRETAMRGALDRWAQRLTQIVTETPAKVTPIRARA